MRLQFSHGNGFPAGSYRAYLDALAALVPSAGVHAIERIGHDPRYPITDSWPHLVDELVAQFDGDADEPLILVGHSLGGFLSLMAAYRTRRPVSAVIMLDSPIIPRWKANVFALLKKTGLDERYSPARFAKRRRDRWRDPDHAYEHFRGKALFTDFGEGALRDYVTAGIASSEDGATLRFDREHEYRIYRTLPHHLHRLTRRPAPCPVGFVAGTRSVESRLAGLDETRRFVGPHLRSIDGGHLFPMERPVEAASLTHALLVELGALEATR